jgi:hypothetical protein
VHVAFQAVQIFCNRFQLKSPHSHPASCASFSFLLSLTFCSTLLPAMIFPKLVPLFAIELALLFNKAAADAVVDWHWYPTASQGCLQSAQNSVQCPSSDVPSFNGCVCRNGNNFLQEAAQCLGRSDNGDLTTVYNVLVSNCGQSQTPVQISLSQWLSWAALSTTPTPPTTATQPTTVTQPTTITQPTTVITTQKPTSPTTSGGATSSKMGSSNTVTVVGGSPSSTTETPVPVTSGSGKSKLGTGAIIGMAAGIPGFCAVVGLLGFLIWRTTRRNPKSDGSRLEGEPGNGGSYGNSPGTAAIEAYEKDRPESSIPSTVSPNPSNRMSGFSAGQGGVPYPTQQPVQHPYAAQGFYPVQQYQGFPAGQPYQPQFATVGQSYVTPTSPMHDMRYPPAVNYSELSSETRAQMP